jgi:hypothetical protein
MGENNMLPDSIGEVGQDGKMSAIPTSIYPLLRDGNTPQPAPKPAP